jgi:serine protease AprX
MARWENGGSGNSGGNSGIRSGFGLLEDRMTISGIARSVLKSTAGAIGLALLIASPAWAASVEIPSDTAPVTQPGTAAAVPPSVGLFALPGAGPAAPSAAAAAIARGDVDGDRIEDALSGRIAASRAGDLFDVIVMFEGPGAVGRGRAAAGPFAVTREFSIINGFQAQLTGPQIRGLSRAPGLFRISGNAQVNMHDVPSNDDMGATDARDLTEGFGVDGSGVTICVIDTGVDAAHEQFDTKGPGGLVPLGPNEFHDAVNGLPDPYDDNGHGSHVSGIATGDGTGWSSLDAEGIGVAPGASLVVAKVLDANGSGSEAQVLQGIDWCAARNDVDIVSMSLGGTGTDGTDATSMAVNCVADPSSPTCGGTNTPKIVVVSAGNSGALWSTIGAPGVAELAITVGSAAEWSGNPLTNWQDDGLYLNTFSSRGPVVDALGATIRIKPDIVGPGSRVVSAYVFDNTPNNSYGVASGTSMSAPFVSGVIALMLDAYPDLGIADADGLPHVKVRSILEQTAIDRGAPGIDNEYGHGVIDAYSAVAEAFFAGGGVLPDGYLPNAYPGYNRLTDQFVADNADPSTGGWTWEFEVTADMLVDPITPIAGTATIDGTYVQTCSTPNPLNPSECWFWNTLWTPDLELILEELTAGSWSQVPPGSGEATFGECPARGECGQVGRAEVVHFIPQHTGTYRFRVFPADDTSNNGVGGNFDFEISMGAPVSEPGGNAAPSVTITSPANGAVFVLGDLVSFAGSANDIEDGPLTESLSWSSDLDGPIGSGAEFSTEILRLGAHTITASVTDSEGLPDDASITVTVNATNTAPTASFTFDTSDLTASFTDTSTDSDGTVVSWLWDFDDGTDTSTLENPSHTYAAEGTYTVTLTVTDNDGDSSVAFTQDVTVALNVGPIASFIVDTPSGCGTYFFPNTCLFTDTSTDSDGNIVLLSWDIGDGNPQQSTFARSSILVTFPADGDNPATMTLTVTDNDGATDTASMTLPISHPAPDPVSVHIADLDDMSASAPRNRWDATVWLQVRDNNGTLIPGATVDGGWSNGTNGGDSCITDANGGCTITKANLKNGVTQVTFSVTAITSAGLDYSANANTDPDGDSTGTAIDLIQPGTAPVPPLTASFTVDRNPCGTDFFPNTCQFTETSNDPEGNIVSWSWDFGGGTVLVGTPIVPGHQMLVEFPAAGPNPVTVTLTVTDGTGATDTTSMTLPISDPLPTPPTAAFSFSCTDYDCTFADESTDDGSIDGWSWVFGDGAVSPDQNPSHTYGSTGSYSVTLTVTDNDGETDSTSQFVTVPVTLNPLSLTATGYKVKGLQKVDLTWSGATDGVDIYRKGSLITTIMLPSGSYTDNIDLKGGGSYIYEVCETGTGAGSATCSDPITVVF